MTTPTPRTPVRLGRGTKANLDIALAAGDIKEGELVYAKDEDKLYMVEGGVFVAAGDGGGAVFIDDLSDVDTSTVAPTDGQILAWVDANSQWEPVTFSGGGATALPDLTDVKDALDSGGLGLWDTDTVGQFPAANGAWRCYAVNSPDVLQFYKFNAAGVDQSSYLLSLVSGNTIRISNDNSTWNDITLLSDATYSAGGGGNTVINMDISDADGTLINGLGGSVYVALPPAPYATDGQVLTYVAANSQWEPATPSAAPVDSVAGKTGVVTLELADNTDVDYGLALGTVYDYLEARSVDEGPSWTCPDDGAFSTAPSTWRTLSNFSSSGQSLEAVLNPTNGGTLWWATSPAGPYTQMTWTSRSFFTYCSGRRLYKLSNVTNGWPQDSSTTVDLYFLTSAPGPGTPADGEVLTWNSANSQWEPVALSGSATRAALGIGEYVDDAAAGTGGVASGAIYYNTTSSDYRLKT